MLFFFVRGVTKNGLRAFSQALLNTVYGNVLFSRARMHAHHKSLVFFRSLSICSCSRRLREALGGSGCLWEALEGSAGFARLCDALGGLRGFERLWEAL